MGKLIFLEFLSGCPLQIFRLFHSPSWHHRFVSRCAAVRHTSSSPSSSRVPFSLETNHCPHFWTTALILPRDGRLCRCFFLLLLAWLEPRVRSSLLLSSFKNWVISYHHGWSLLPFPFFGVAATSPASSAARTRTETVRPKEDDDDEWLRQW